MSDSSESWFFFFKDVAFVMKGLLCTETQQCSNNKKRCTSKTRKYLNGKGKLFIPYLDIWLGNETDDQHMFLPQWRRKLAKKF